MFCTQCGKKLSGDAKFCPQCGAKVSGADKPNVNAQGILADAVNEPIPEQVQAAHVEEPIVKPVQGENNDEKIYEPAVRPNLKQNNEESAHEPIQNQNNEEQSSQPAQNEKIEEQQSETPDCCKENAAESEETGTNAVSESKEAESGETVKAEGTEPGKPEKTEEIGSCDIAKPEKNEISKTDTINVPEPCDTVELKGSTEDASADIKENEENTAGKTSEDEKGTAAEIKEVNENTGIEPKTEAGVSTEHVTVEPYVCPDPAAIETAPKKSKKKLIIIIAAAVVLAAIIVVVVLLVYFNAPEQRLVKAVKEQDYNTAYTILTEETVKETDKTVDAADTVVQDILSQFRRDDINFEEAFDKLDALEGTPGAYAAEDAADRIETILEDEYEDNFRKLEEAGYLNVDEATEIIVKVKDAFDYRSEYRDCYTWSLLLSDALEGEPAYAAQTLLTIEDLDEPAYEAALDEYPATREEIGRCMVNYAIYLLDDAAGVDGEKNINCDLQETLAYSILDGTAPEDFSAMFEASNYDHMCDGLNDLSVISGVNGSGKVLMAIRSEDDNEYGAEYDILVDYDDASVVPLENIPESLDDVEYIVLFYFDKVEMASYSTTDGRTIPGYQTNGSVSVIHCPTGEIVYTSETIWGPDLKDTYYVYNSTTRILGDRPDLSVYEDDVLEAIGAGSVL